MLQTTIPTRRVNTSHLTSHTLNFTTHATSPKRSTRAFWTALQLSVIVDVLLERVKIFHCTASKRLPLTASTFSHSFAFCPEAENALAVLTFRTDILKMSKRMKSDGPMPSSEECHDAAVRAILHVVDEALGEGSPLSQPEFYEALDKLEQQGNLKKWYKHSLISYDAVQLKKLVARLVHQIDVLRYDGSLDELLRHGSSCIMKSYLYKMGLVDDDHDELSADHLDSKNPVELFVDQRVPENQITSSKTVAAKRPRRRDYCT
jgi:hypothetical protein